MSVSPTWISAALLCIFLQTQSLVTAGCASPVQVQSSNFSPGTHSSRSPTYSPEWDTLHNLGSTFWVCSFQAERLWPISNLKSLMSWNRGLLHVQNLNIDVGHATEWLEYSWIPWRSFGFKDCLYSNFQHITTEKDGRFQVLYSEQLNSGLSVTIMQFQSILVFHLTIFLSTGDFF